MEGQGIGGLPPLHSCIRVNGLNRPIRTGPRDGGCTMNTTESHANHQERTTIESDPAYDYAEDQEVDQPWVEEVDAPEDDERVVPIDEAEEFRAEDEES